MKRVVEETKREEMARAHGEHEAQWCRCVGGSCSGCEEKTKKCAAKDWLTGYSSRDEEVEEWQWEYKNSCKFRDEQDKIIDSFKARLDQAAKRIEEQGRRLSQAYQDYITLNNSANNLAASELLLNGRLVEAKDLLHHCLEWDNGGERCYGDIVAFINGDANESRPERYIDKIAKEEKKNV